MSVLGSQLEIDMDPEGEAAVIPRHVGNTGTGCYKLHDHRIQETKRRADGPVTAAGQTLIFSKDLQPETTFSANNSTSQKQSQDTRSAVIVCMLLQKKRRDKHTMLKEG